MIPRRHLVALLSAALFVTCAYDAPAAPSRQDVVAAQEAMKQGTAAEKKSEWETAREAFQRAVDRNDTPEARLHLARADAGLGHLLEAASSYRMVLEAKNAPPNVKAAAKKELAAVVERIPRLTIKAPDNFTGTVQIDNSPVSSADLGKPVERNPGDLVVTAKADGFEPFKQTVSLPEGASKTVEISLDPSAPAAKAEPVKVSTNDGRTRKTLAYVSLGVGGVGAIVGTVFGLSAKSTRNDLRSSCANDVCAEDQRETYDKGKQQAMFSTIGFITAGVGIGLGTVLLLTAPKKSEEADAPKASITPYVGPANIGVYGKF